ncbi:Protein of unknown function [Gryllus bimaculatus]|nr:Protein of unknown function [Gryllus bimaculatus]
MAVIATIIGILALTAAAHYYYTTYNNEQPQEEYNNPPEDHWYVPHYYHNEENSIDIFPGPSNAQDTTIKTAPNGLLSDHTLAYEIKSSTSQDETTPYSMGNTQSTSTERGNEIEILQIQRKFQH